MEAVAQGRVWTGKQALAHGLVDKLGGLEVCHSLIKASIFTRCFKDAIKAAKTLANIPETATPFVQIFPKKSLKPLLKPPKNRDEADSYHPANHCTFTNTQ